MRLSEINQQTEKYILDESIKTFYHKMINQANYLIARVNSKREKVVVEKEINDMYDTYSDTLPILRTLFAYDRHMRDEDSDLPSIVGVARLINGDEETAMTELRNFREKVIEKHRNVKNTYRAFCNEIQNTNRRNYRGYEGAAFVAYVLEMDEHMQSQLEDFYGTQAGAKIEEHFEAFANKGMTEIVLEMTAANLLYEPVDSFNEAETKKKELDNFYMVVEMQLFDNEKSATIPHRNFKNIIATRAKTQAEARRKMKKRMNQSLRELNTKLKNRSMKCACKHKNWDTNSMMHKGYDTMKSKNIKSLSGSDAISTGAYLLKGMVGHGTVQNLPEYAPNRYAIHSSKASVSRYLNKECRDE